MPNVLTAAKKILVCDDDSDIAGLLAHLLTEAGYEVSTASGHDEFFKKFSALRPDLIMLDIRMPEHDGFWIADELQRLDNKAPILFCTAHNRSVYRMCAPIAGAVDFIVKPFDPDALVARIRQILKPHSAESSSWFLSATCYRPSAPDQSTE
jgi:DNA-binding response OmpR family regulator